MCLGSKPTPAAPPPPPAPPPVETGDLSIKSDKKKKQSTRGKRAKSGSAPFRKNLSVNTGSSATGSPSTGLSIHR